MGDMLEAAAGQIEGKAPHAREALDKAPSETNERTPGVDPNLRDKYGNPFDPRRHQTLPDGTPRLTRDGKLSIKGGRLKVDRTEPQGARRPGDGAGGGSSIPPPPPGAARAEAEESARYRTTAQVTVATLSATATMAGGETWKPSPQEQGAMTEAWEEYYRVRGIRDLPPEMGIALVTLMYVGGTPERRANLRAAWTRLRERYTDARTPVRQDGNGKDHARSQARGSVPPPVDRARPDA